LSEMWINISVRRLKDLLKQVWKTYTYISESHCN